MDMMNDYSKMSVGKIVAKDYRKAIIFRSHGIDFCCGGKKSVEEACQEANVSTAELLNELQEIDLKKDTVQDFENMPLDDLINHIVEKHHQYTKKTLLELEPLVKKVAMVHGDWRPELRKIETVFQDLVAELIPHMQKEEIVLFPAIKALLKGGASPFDQNSIGHPISMMEYEHDMAGNLMKEIRTLTDDFILPKGACATYTVVYKVLEEFEADLHQHIHLENNILFPKVVNKNF